MCLKLRERHSTAHLPDDPEQCRIMPQPPHTPFAFEVIVIGGGPAGLATAIAIARTGRKTALVARRAPYADNRTTALLGGSVDFLQGLEVWDQCREQASALIRMRLIDDTGRLIRAPEVTFAADELGLDAFGYNIQNRDLIAAMESCAAKLDTLTRFDAGAATVSPADEHVAVQTTDNQLLSGKLVVGADGRDSICRTAAGIDVKREPLSQTALTFNVRHSRPHNHISTEFHTAEGPCVFVPLPGNRSSVVWVSKPSNAERLRTMDDAALSRAVEMQAHSILGKMELDSERHLFPLAFERPLELARNRIALVGESAHVLPPIGAQGLNLGLRDAATLTDIVQGIDAITDPGAESVLAQYRRARLRDINVRTTAISMANRSLLNEHLPVQAMRAAGMHLLRAVPSIKRIAMREGLASWSGR